ncbi:MAG: heparinase II/III family protein, partial [bacterium]
MTALALPIRALRRARRELRHLFVRLRDHRQPTFVAAGAALPAHARFAFLDGNFVGALAADFPEFPDVLRQQAADALEHRFDLLGSGPTLVAHGVHCHGVEGIVYAMSQPVHADRAGNWLAGRINAANLAEAQRLWRLVDAGYVPIDWQLDFKSGYRWREVCWHRDIRFAHRTGVDIKVPWELARCQHLPALALACHFAAAGHAAYLAPQVYARELRNQALDFLAANPPGFGVNWACAMDIAIRAANLLLARDIALAAGIRFDAEFEAAFAAAMRAHGRHIVANLEWAPRHRGNHYLADIAGLAFVAAWLPCDAEVDAWLAFAAQELIAEIDYQFHADGSNFEASVCYHRLSAETVLWTAALLAALPPEKKAALQRPQRHRALPRLRAAAQPLHALPGGGGESPLRAR